MRFGTQAGRPTVDWDWKELPEAGDAAKGVVEACLRVIGDGLLTGLLNFRLGHGDDRVALPHRPGRSGAGDLDFLQFSTFYFSARTGWLQLPRSLRQTLRQQRVCFFLSIASILPDCLLFASITALVGAVRLIKVW